MRPVSSFVAVSTRTLTKKSSRTRPVRFLGLGSFRGGVCCPTLAGVKVRQSFHASVLTRGGKGENLKSWRRRT